MPGLWDVVIKCESPADAQKAADFINKRVINHASWCRNELTIWSGVKFHIPYPDVDEEGDPQSSEEKEAAV